MQDFMNGASAMGSALYLLSAILVMGDGTPDTSVADARANIEARIAQSSARIPAPVLPAMPDSEPKVRVLTASDQKSPHLNQSNSRVQRWTF
jgi:hypothetical protein